MVTGSSRSVTFRIAASSWLTSLGPPGRRAEGYRGLRGGLGVPEVVAGGGLDVMPHRRLGPIRVPGGERGDDGLVLFPGVPAAGGHEERREDGEPDPELLDQRDQGGHLAGLMDQPVDT